MVKLTLLIRACIIAKTRKNNFFTINQHIPTAEAYTT